MTSSKSASSQKPPSQLGSGGLAKAIGLRTKSRPMRTTTSNQRIFIGLSLNGRGARKRRIGYPLRAGSTDKRVSVVKHERCRCESLCTPQRLDAPGPLEDPEAQSLPPRRASSGLSRVGIACSAARARSEERRVGKECRSRCSPCLEK